ncbi:MAG: Asp23/Gls24 family envelope stress response protein [Fusobacteria bacterium]|nr:Asp23/Gls24 family envelope stress response protein [Fusobacteriota bacterium]
MSEIEKINETGKIKIADNVAASIANLAAQEVEGVVKVIGSSTSSISEMFGRKNLAKGVKVNMDEEGTNIELSLVIQHGVNIVKLAEEVQNNVKEAVESMTGIKVKGVDVTISDIVFEEKKEEEDKE